MRTCLTTNPLLISSSQRIPHVSMPQEVLALAGWRNSGHNPLMVGNLSVLLSSLGFNVYHWWISLPGSCVVIGSLSAWHRQAEIRTTPKEGFAKSSHQWATWASPTTFPKLCHYFARSLFHIVPSKAHKSSSTYCCYFCRAAFSLFTSGFGWMAMLSKFLILFFSIFIILYAITFQQFLHSVKYNLL